MLEHLQRSRTTSSEASPDISAGKQLVLLVERVILKIDEALLEARFARDAMLLYIQVSCTSVYPSLTCKYLTSTRLPQFIKDSAYDVAASENTATVPGGKPDIALR